MIRPEDLQRLISKHLEEYGKEVQDVVEQSAGDVAKEIVKELKKSSPKRYGKYGKSWRVRKESAPGTGTRYIVHNKDHYRLTHLLEFGHATPGGGRTKAEPHIGPAEQMAAKSFEEKIRSKL